MYDSGKVIFGIVVFIILMTIPIWYNLAFGTGARPDPIVQTKDVPGKDQCVMDASYMRGSHMDVLNEWRDVVVREGKRIHKTEDGRIYNMSLSKTCLDCHSNKEQFCDRCHNYMSVDPYCWSCHTIPEEGNNGR